MKLLMNKMKMVFTLLLLSGAGLFAQESEKVVRIVLEEGRSDVLQINEQNIEQAYVYGSRENVIKFLINDKYIQHQMDKGIVYNFLFDRKDTLGTLDKKEALLNDTNKILIVTSDSNAYHIIHDKVFDAPAKSSNTFQLGEINNLKVFVSQSIEDTSIFKHPDKVAKIQLAEGKSDVFQVDGEPISSVTIFGSKNNIIRFLINDKYIKHRMMDEGASYTFTSSKNFNKIYEYFEEKASQDKILIVIGSNQDFLEAYNKINKEKLEDIKKDLSFKLDKINDMDVLILGPDQLINP